MLTYIDCVFHELIDPEVYPLTWYEIPLDETPPAFIGDLQLILIAIDRTLTFTGLIEDEQFSFPLFYEDQSFYLTSWEEYFPRDEVAKRRERLTAEVDHLLVQPRENSLTNCTFWWGCTYYEHQSPWYFMIPQNINGTLYWMALENNLPDDMSLIEDLDYIDGWNEYYGDYRLYKVEDIVALHREQE